MLAVSSEKQKKQEWKRSTIYVIACGKVKQHWKLPWPAFRSLCQQLHTQLYTGPCSPQASVPMGNRRVRVRELIVGTQGLEQCCPQTLEEPESPRSSVTQCILTHSRGLILQFSGINLLRYRMELGIYKKWFLNHNNVNVGNLSTSVNLSWFNSLIKHQSDGRTVPSQSKLQP